MLAFGLALVNAWTLCHVAGPSAQLQLWWLVGVFRAEGGGGTEHYAGMIGPMWLWDPQWLPAPNTVPHLGPGSPPRPRAAQFSVGKIASWDLSPIARAGALSGRRGQTCLSSEGTLAAVVNLTTFNSNHCVTAAPLEAGSLGLEYYMHLGLIDFQH